MHTAVNNERRQHPRYALDVEVQLTAASDDKESARHLFTVHDVSLSGMCISSSTAVPRPGDTLSLCLAEKREGCSSDHVIEATVVRNNGGLVGIRFDTVGVLVLKDIQRLLRDARLF